MNNYKKVIYDNYIKNHNKNMYGEKSLASVIAKFSTCSYYFKKHLPTNKKANILDVGCGDGNFVYWLHSLNYENAAGIDISQEQINQGLSFGIKNLKCADLSEFLKHNTIKYDLIIARDVIEHFTKDEVFDILALVHNNLTQEGRFIMQVPNGEGIHYTSVFYGDYTHEVAYTATSVNQIALNTGFCKTACYPTGPIPTGIVSSIRYLLWKLIINHHKFRKMIETGSSKGVFTQNLIAVIDK